MECQDLSNDLGHIQELSHESLTPTPTSNRHNLSSNSTTPKNPDKRRKHDTGGSTTSNGSNPRQRVRSILDSDYPHAVIDNLSSSPHVHSPSSSPLTPILHNQLKFAGHAFDDTLSLLIIHDYISIPQSIPRGISSCCAGVLEQANLPSFMELINTN